MNGVGASFRVSPGGGPVTTGSGTPVPMPEPAYAETMSAITRLMTDPGGRIWVRRRAADGGIDGPIDIITGAGRYIGTLPSGTRLPVAVSVSGLAAYVDADELDVQRLVVRRLPTSWRR
jgi:hypothetical protein